MGTFYENIIGMKKIQLITTFLILISASLYGQTFTQITEGDIVTNGASSFGASWGDYNNDGFIDLFVANRVGNNFLFKNNSDGTFTKIITGDIVNDGGVSLSGSWGDYDNDGDLDLFVANGFDIIVENNFLYRNNGDESFTKITVGPLPSADLLVVNGIDMKISSVTQSTLSFTFTSPNPSARTTGIDGDYIMAFTR